MLMDNDRSWSNLTLEEIQKFLESLRIRIPLLKERMEYEIAYGTARGADVKIKLWDGEQEHFLLLEVEQYSSGRLFFEKVKSWARRHSEHSNATTIVVSLLLPALYNRLTGDLSEKDDNIKEMVYSPSFRLFPGRGDGNMPDELREYLVGWIETRL